MMEREFISQRIKEWQIQDFVERSLTNVGHSHTIMKKTPLGEKIVVFASRPGLVVGRRGANIKELTLQLKKQFNLENPQIEISEVENIFLDPNIVAEKIVSSLERFGTARFKGIGHKMMEKIMEAGARGVEILISGKVPGARARSWRFYQGYVKKCGDAAQSAVRRSVRSAQLKPGTVGIQVSIIPPGIRLPDDIRFREVEAPAEQVAVVETVEAAKNEDEKKPKKRAPRKKKTEAPSDAGNEVSGSQKAELSEDVKKETAPKETAAVEGVRDEV